MSVRGDNWSYMKGVIKKHDEKYSISPSYASVQAGLSRIYSELGNIGVYDFPKKLHNHFPY